MRIVLISRREMPRRACRSCADGGRPARRSARRTLAFTPDEAAEALAARGDAGVDAGAAVAATGGWVTGVLFEAWRSAEHVGRRGRRGRSAARLPVRAHPRPARDGGPRVPGRRRRCSTRSTRRARDRARHAGRRRSASRRCGAPTCPSAWRTDGRALRCHPRFREYLLRAARAPRRRRRCARSGSRTGACSRRGPRRGGDRGAAARGRARGALPTAERAIFAVIERLDFASRRALARALRTSSPRGRPPLVTAELMLALAQEDFSAAAALADRSPSAAIASASRARRSRGAR